MQSRAEILGGTRSRSGSTRHSLALQIVAMSKRTATELQQTSIEEQSSRKTPRGNGNRESALQQDEIGEFEDGWEDEFESDEEIFDNAEENEGEDGMLSAAATMYVKSNTVL